MAAAVTGTRAAALSTVGPASCPLAAPAANLSIIVPVYNEADNLPALVRDVERHVPGPYVLYVIYDFDADSTLPVARKLAATRPWLRPLKNRGQGVVSAIRTGFEAAERGPTLVMMADLSDDLRVVPR